MTDNPIRKARHAWNDPGHAHYLTYSCYKRWPLLSRDQARQWAVEALEHTRRNQDVSLWAYVIMPEHVHVLLHPRRMPYTMRRILASLKVPVSRAAKEHLILTGQTDWLERLTAHDRSRSAFRFWQPGGGHDHNIVKERTVTAIVEYIHANPVRRGLVASPTDWTWSSARYWEGYEDVPLIMDHPEEYIGS